MGDMPVGPVTARVGAPASTSLSFRAGRAGPMLVDVVTGIADVAVEVVSGTGRVEAVVSGGPDPLTVMWDGGEQDNSGWATVRLDVHGAAWPTTRGSGRARLRVPAGSILYVATTAGAIDITGPVAPGALVAVEAATESGHVDITSGVDDLRVATIGGAVWARRVFCRVDASTCSGDITLEAYGGLDLFVWSVTGAVSVDSLTAIGRFEARSYFGTVTVHGTTPPYAKVGSVLGDETSGP